MGFNCAPDLADFLYSYEADFIQAYLQKKENKLSRPLNITIPYEDAVMSLNNCKFCDFFYHIYPIELEIKETPDISKCD